MVLMPPPPLLLTVAGRKYHYPPVQVIAHLLPRKFWELVLIARLYTILRNNLEPRLVRQSAVLVLSCDIGNVLAGCSFRFQPLWAAYGKVSEILLLNFQRTQGEKFTPLLYGDLPPRFVHPFSENILKKFFLLPKLTWRRSLFQRPRDALSFSLSTP